MITFLLAAEREEEASSDDGIEDAIHLVGLILGKAPESLSCYSKQFLGHLWSNIIVM